MRFYLAVSILSILVAIALALIIYGQNGELILLNKGIEKLQIDSKKFDTQHTREQQFKVSMEKLMDQRKKAWEDLEATMAKLNTDMEKKKTENDACQAEKKTKAEELASAEKEHTETQATLKAEADAWNQEINTLKVKLTEISPVCDHVKSDPLAQKLCAKEATNKAEAVQTTTQGHPSETK